MSAAHTKADGAHAVIPFFVARVQTTSISFVSPFQVERALTEVIVSVLETLCYACTVTYAILVC